MPARMSFWWEVAIQLGKAVAFSAPKARKLFLVVRGDGLAASVSCDLIDRIAALPNVELQTHTEITSVGGKDMTGLQTVQLYNQTTGVLTTREINHLFLFVGAEPNTDWLHGCSVRVDQKGFVLTGNVGVERLSPRSRETSIPGIFAIGDVRAGSTKRVAAAVGEGAAAVAQIHAYLAS